MISVGLLLTTLSAASGVDGRIVYVTAERAYLDKGAADGLAVGHVVELSRSGRRLGVCTVDAVADGSATCTGGEGRDGDRFRVELSAAPATPTVRSLPPLVGEATRARALTKVAATPYAKVDADRPIGSGISRSILRGRLAQEAWVANASGGTGLHRTSARVELLGVPLGALGLRAFADVEAWQWLASRGNVTSLFVREVAVVSRQRGNPLAVAVGRVWPWAAPGITAIDGAQVAYRNDDESLEVGLLGGLVPGFDLEPRWATWLGGAYGRYIHTTSPGSWLRLWQGEGRVSISGDADGAARVGAELTGHLWLHAPLSLGADVRFDDELRGARLYARWQAHADVSVGLATRYVGAPAPGELRNTFTLAADESSSAELDATWRAARWLSVGVVAGSFSDLSRGRHRVGVGPEAAWLGILGARGDIRLGYREELGVWRGRSGYLQIGRAFDRLDVTVRGSYAEDDLGGPLIERDLGVYAHLRVRLLDELALRFSTYGSASLWLREEVSAPMAIGGQLALEGTL